jgi:uncharacterized membrane protein
VARPAPSVSPPSHDASAEVPPPPPRLPTLPSLPKIDWEGLVGVKLFSWIAGVALVLGVVFFLRYSIQQGWLSPPIRMGLGLVVGVGLLVFCELRIAQRYPVTANALDAAGIAILFSTLFAAHALWKLLPQFPVFILMTLVTAVAVLLSIRRDSVFIALLGLLGGFATPALLSTGEDRPVGLFSYLLLLNSGLAWVAFRRGWPWLTALSVAFTALYQWAWVIKFLDAARLPLAMSIFAVFPVLHVIAVALARRGRAEGGGLDPLFGRTATAAATLPVIFALYTVAVPAYGERYALLFGFLLFIVVGLTLVSAAGGPSDLYILGALSSLIGFVIWFAVSYSSGAWPGILAFVAVFVLFHACVPLMAKAVRGRPLSFGGQVSSVARLAWPALEFTDEAVAAVVAPALLFTFPVLAWIEPATAAPGLLFGSLFALLIVLAGATISAESGRAHFLGAVFVLAAEAVWSVKHLSPERLLPALTIYAGFGLFYLAVPIVAERAGKRLRPEGSGALVLFASLGLLFFLAAGPVARVALWGLALLLLLLNVGLLAEASRSRFPLLAFAGIVLSWIVLAVWWMTAMVAGLLIPLLMVISGFALLITGGTLWASARAEAEQATDALPTLTRSLSLALVAYVFLCFLAAQPALIVPPWPVLAVLGLLDLAVGVTALYTRSGEIHVAALTASQLILIRFITAAPEAPSPFVGMLAADAVGALALVWIPLARRRGAAGLIFPAAAGICIVLAQIVAIVAAELRGAPGLAWLLPNHLALLSAFLGIAWIMDGHGLAVLAVAPTALASALWIFRHVSDATWLSGLFFGAAIYAVFLAYPLVLGARTRRARDPYLAAVVASVPFFFLARHCLIAGGFGRFIGVLPVTQALLMLGVLLRLLRLQPPGERETGRLALVAGAALAFITVAIPLQLDREWITIGWALEGMALAWLYGRIPHRGLFLWSAGLCAVAFGRLCLNPAVFSYHPRGALPIWNWYLYTYLVTAAALFATARILRRTNDRIDEYARVSDFLPAGGTALLFLLLNIEIADFYSIGPTLTFNFSAGLAQDLTYTLGWALFAIGLLAAGIVSGARLARITALALLVVTVVKCFLHDLWRLGGLYRVGSFVGLAVCLAIVAVLLQRFVLGAQKEAT